MKACVELSSVLRGLSHLLCTNSGEKKKKKKKNDEVKCRPLSGKWQSRNHFLESTEDRSSRCSALNGGGHHRLSGAVVVVIVVVMTEAAVTITVATASCSSNSITP